MKTRLYMNIPGRLPAVIALLAATATGLQACNTGSGVTTGLQPTAEMRREAANAPVPPGTLGSEAALTDPNSRRPDATTMALAPSTAPSAGQQASLPPASAMAPVYFLPLTGAPQSTVTNLAAAMRDAAARESVPVVPTIEQGAQYQIKGYFSAINDGSNVTLVYVWDITDRNGARIHRISGQERGGSSSNDPWTGVSSDMLNRVAGATMSNLRLWMAGRSAG